MTREYPGSGRRARKSGFRRRTPVPEDREPGNTSRAHRNKCDSPILSEIESCATINSAHDTEFNYFLFIKGEKVAKFDAEDFIDGIFFTAAVKIFPCFPSPALSRRAAVPFFRFCGKSSVRREKPKSADIARGCAPFPGRTASILFLTISSEILNISVTFNGFPF